MQNTCQFANVLFANEHTSKKSPKNQKKSQFFEKTEKTVIVLSVKNGADCYSKTEEAVTVLMAQN